MTEKNFDELEVGCWYLTRSGDIVKIVNTMEDLDYEFESGSESYTRKGVYRANDLSVRDLVTKIEPPAIVPCKRKKKLKVERWINIYTDGTIRTCSSEESAKQWDKSGGRKRADCIPFVWEGEVDEE